MATMGCYRCWLEQGSDGVPERGTRVPPPPIAGPEGAAAQGWVDFEDEEGNFEGSVCPGCLTPDERAAAELTERVVGGPDAFDENSHPEDTVLVSAVLRGEPWSLWPNTIPEGWEEKR